MQDALEKIKSSTYVVNNGSGVLVQAMTKEFSYIITAKHVIQEDRDDPSKGIIPEANIIIRTPTDGSISTSNVYVHPVLDLAILVVDYLPTSIKVYEQDIKFEDTLVMFGYPNYNNIHRNPERPISDWVENYSLKVLDVKDEEIKTRTPEAIQHQDIEGFSGGGTLSIVGDEAYLVGILGKLRQSGEFVNRIISIPLKNIFLIIENRGIPPVKPSFFGNLSELQSDIFNIENCFSPADIKKATDILKSNSSSSLENCEFHPYNIIQNHSESICCLGDSQEFLEDKEFWIAYLEFLHVEGLITPEITWDDSFLEYLCNNYKFVYIKGREGWKGHLSNILSTNVDHLTNGGKLLLVDFGQMPSSPDQLNSFRENIPSNVADGIDEESIAHVQSIIQKSISILHLQKLHEQCITSREAELNRMNKITQRQEISNMILEGYTEYLSQEATSDE